MPSSAHPLLACIPPRSPRHRKPPESRRTQRVVVRVSSCEYAQIVALAVDRRCSLATILRGVVHSLPVSVADRPIVSEFRRVAGNLNQVLRLLHSDFPAEGELREVIADLHQVLSELHSNLTNVRREA